MDLVEILARRFGWAVSVEAVPGFEYVVCSSGVFGSQGCLYFRGSFSGTGEPVGFFAGVNGAGEATCLGLIVIGVAP